MKWLNWLFPLCLLTLNAWGQGQNEKVYNELDEIRAERSAPNRVAPNPYDRFGWEHPRAPFWDTPRASDFPSFRYPTPPGFGPQYYNYNEGVRPAPVQRPVAQANCTVWEKVRKPAGWVETDGGRVWSEASTTTCVGNVPVPQWANWYRYCNGQPQFAQ